MQAIYRNSWNELGVTIPSGKMSGSFYHTCPFCSKGRKPHNQKVKCMQIKLDEKYFKCFNCDVYGYISETKKDKEYKRPEPVKLKDVENPVSLAWVDYFLKRGISITTLKQVGVFTTEYGFSQNEYKKSEAVVFPYYWNGSLIFYKYRGINKEFSLSVSPQLIFWNIDSIKELKDYVIICEGEIDALSWIESGYKNAISVPNGAVLNSRSNQYEYLDRCIDLLKDIVTIYMSTDNDSAGLKLREDLIRRLGKERCKIINLPEGCKDANDALKLGKGTLRESFENAKWIPIDGIKKISDYKDKLDSVYKDGRKPFCRIGINGLDDLITFNNGDSLTLISGAPQSSKSQLTFSIALRMSALYGMKWGVFSPETGEGDEVYQVLIEILSGENFIKNNKWGLPQISENMKNWVESFIEEHFVIYDDVELEKLSLTDFLEIGKELVVKYGINGLIADPYNRFEAAFTSHGNNIAESLNYALAATKKFCRKYNVHTILVPHPASLAHSNGRISTAYQINGGAAWFNQVDNIILLNRQYGEATPDLLKKGIGDMIVATVEKVKKNFAGKKGEADLFFHIPTNRIGYKDFLGNIFFDTHQTLMSFKDSVLKNTEKQQTQLREIEYDPFEEVVPEETKNQKMSDFRPITEEDFEQYF